MDTRRWSGRNTQEHIGTIEEIQEWIPSFTRSSGWRLVDEGENKYLDVIIREPLESDGEYIRDRLRIPVCTVTKQYALFQHQDVFNALVAALKKRVPDLDSLSASLCITEYGESMWIRFTLANFQLDKAERYPMLLEVSGLNTVVSGKALNVRLSWYEPKSEIRIPYGMLSRELSEDSVNFKMRHLRKEFGLDTDIFSRQINQFLTEHLDRLSNERDRYRRWIEAKVSHSALVRWIDTTVQSKWTYEEAVRSYHLIMDGMDVEVKRVEVNGENIDKKEKEDKRGTLPRPSQLPLHKNWLLFDSSRLPSVYCIPKKSRVSGIEHFAPAKNAFDVSLVLAWIVSQRKTIPKQLGWTDIPELIYALVDTDEQLKGIR